MTGKHLPGKHVTAALLVDGGYLFIARRAAGEELAGKWEFPGGKIEPGETPEASLKREMREELGVEVGVVEHFADSEYSYDHARVILSAYWVFLKQGTPSQTVHDRTAWVSPEELWQYEFAPADVPLVDWLAATSQPPGRRNRPDTPGGDS